MAQFGTLGAQGGFSSSSGFCHPPEAWATRFSDPSSAVNSLKMMLGAQRPPIALTQGLWHQVCDVCDGYVNVHMCLYMHVCGVDMWAGVYVHVCPVLLLAEGPFSAHPERPSGLKSVAAYVCRCTGMCTCVHVLLAGDQGRGLRGVAAQPPCSGPLSCWHAVPLQDSQGD